MSAVFGHDQGFINSCHLFLSRERGFVYCCHAKVTKLCLRAIMFGAKQAMSLHVYCGCMPSWTASW